MKAEQFCYWLQGHFELSDDKELSVSQVEEIKNHLNMVFYYDLDKQPSKEDQEKLNAIHENLSPNTDDTRIRC
jgi:hypothetical protein